MSNILSPNQPNIVLWLPFSEGSQNSAYDYSPEGNDGNIVGADYVKIQDGGYALDFDGGATNIVYANASPTSSGTVMAWINLDAVSVETIFSFTDLSDSAAGMLFDVVAGRARIYHLTGGGSGTNRIYANTTTITTGSWFHVAFVSTGTAYKIYVNGNDETLDVSTGADDGAWGSDMSITQDTIGVGAQKRSSGTSGVADGRIRLPVSISVALSAEAIKKFYRETFIQ